MYLSHLRTIQGLISDLSGLALTNAVDLNRTLQQTLPKTDDQVTSLRFVDVTARGLATARGILFTVHSDPKTLSRLILPDNRHPAAMEISQPANAGNKTATDPMLVDLFYGGGGKRRKTVDVAHYFFSGALTAYEDKSFGYTLLAERSQKVEQLAFLFHTLDMRVENLPFRPGRKQATVDLLKSLGIAYVGDLVQRDADALQKELGDFEWKAIGSMLKALNLKPGTPIPQWRRPSSR